MALTTTFTPENMGFPADFEGIALQSLLIAERSRRSLIDDKTAAEQLRQLTPETNSQSANSCAGSEVKE